MSTLFLLALLACSDTYRASWKAVGEPGSITCYSGGQVIFDGQSTGKIESEDRSDGWKFMDATNNRLVRVSGDCVVKN